MGERESREEGGVGWGGFEREDVRLILPYPILNLVQIITADMCHVTGDNFFFLFLIAYPPICILHIRLSACCISAHAKIFSVSHINDIFFYQ